MRTPRRWFVALLALAVTASLAEAAKSITDSRKPQTVVRENAYVSTQGEWGVHPTEKRHSSFLVYLSYGPRSLSVDCSSRRCVIEFAGAEKGSSLSIGEHPAA
ncbi:hypothetical protein [Terriglobus saanensis]|uniref:Uncharacterized protein n=1 Tax=Terriglobus saanensis (strain ATCC BAA-1853 / DSM 23119 / SP1PR4) TaxID=401053 RepID=E8V040_TERSS|nr:hypothetical protein [Terriglobus saanensis]ADV82195.1 hypothetical protein AciPR4_1371 [Terriglobus saanensis SP1PR4]